jgi:hypothetical protein
MKRVPEDVWKAKIASAKFPKEIRRRSRPRCAMQRSNLGSGLDDRHSPKKVSIIQVKVRYGGQRAYKRVDEDPDDSASA